VVEKKFTSPPACIWPIVSQILPRINGSSPSDHTMPVVAVFSSLVEKLCLDLAYSATARSE
jgi:hypothetical protein